MNVPPPEHEAEIRPISPQELEADLGKKRKQKSGLLIMLWLGLIALSVAIFVLSEMIFKPEVASVITRQDIEVDALLADSAKTAEAAYNDSLAMADVIAIDSDDTAKATLVSPVANASAPATVQVAQAVKATPAPATVSKQPEKTVVKPDSAKVKQKPVVASAWVDQVDSALVSLNRRLDETETINQQQSQAITSLTVDVDWLVKERAIDYSKAKNNGQIVMDDVRAFIETPTDGRRLMWENAHK